MKQIDITGMRFGRLVALSQRRREDGVVVWMCRCDCGVEKEILSSGMRIGRTQSCGCLRTSIMRRLKTTHGQRKRSEYAIWLHMNQRCSNPKNNSYANYGGRGITVSAEWSASFEAFFADMGPRPSPKHSIDRIDNDRGYSRENCRWADATTQSVNRRIPAPSPDGRNIRRERGRFVVVVKRRGRNKYLGSFGTLADAAAARDRYVAMIDSEPQGEKP